MARSRPVPFPILAILTSLVCALWFSDAGGADPAGRGSQLDAWMADPDLSPQLRQRAAQLQSQRESHNVRVTSVADRLNDVRRRWESKAQTCQGRLSAAQRSSCDSAFASLRSEHDRHRSAMDGLMPAYNAIVSAFSALQRDVQAYRAAQRGADQRSWDAAWSKGREDARGCYPQNGHGYCSGAGGDYASCSDGYAAGFNDGAGVRDQVLERAYQLGRADAAAGRENASFDHPEARGSCRIQWVEHYDRGHFDGRSGG